MTDWSPRMRISSAAGPHESQGSFFTLRSGCSKILFNATPRDVVIVGICTGVTRSLGRRLMDRSQVDSYLKRIGDHDPESLADLQWAHQRTVPFENLSIHLGEEIVLAEQPLYDKI